VHLNPVMFLQDLLLDLLPKLPVMYLAAAASSPSLLLETALAAAAASVAAVLAAAAAAAAAGVAAAAGAANSHSRHPRTHCLCTLLVYAPRPVLRARDQAALC